MNDGKEFAGDGVILQIPLYKFGGVEGYAFLTDCGEKFIETVDMDLSLTDPEIGEVVLKSPKPW